MSDRDRSRFFHVSPDEFRKPVLPFGDEEARHIATVLRLGEGDRVTAVNGEGEAAIVRLVTSSGGLLGEVESRFRPEANPSRTVTLAVAVTKGREMDEIIERCSEIGVTRFVPLVTKRTVRKSGPLDERKRRDRWERIAMRGMKISGSAVLPGIFPARTVAELAGEIDREGTISVLLDREGDVPLEAVGGGEEILLIVGPEGGFETEEKDRLVRVGSVRATLGPRNLRTATASIAASSVLLTPREAPGRRKEP